jgi:tRNA pseudouridine38-40 synthase
MKRYFFECCYDGSNYHGWQFQPNAISVQEVIEKSIHKFFNESKVSIIGCGRTDAGVHAKQYYFHLDCFSEIDLKSFIYKLNTILPKDISVFEAWLVNSDFHARFSAEKRTYRYVISNQKNPFEDKLSYLVKEKLDLDMMNKCADELLKHKDFTSFSKVNTDVKNNLCHVFECFWTENEKQLVFHISANRFLRNMVRAIVGTMLDVGKGKLSLIDFKSIIKEQDRSSAGSSAPAKGLFLYEVKYPNWP